jgi:peptide subunit release factor 1 (eRF1)
MLALFIGPNGELAYELPVALSNFAHYGKPQIAKFLRALDEYQEYLVVLFAQDRARAINVFLGESAAEVMIHVDQTWNRKVHKTAHDSSQADRLDEIDRRFARHAAGELDKHFLGSDDVERIIFGGNLQLAHAVRNYLHPYVADRVIAMLPIPIDTATHDIAAQVRPVADASEREFEEHLVANLINRARAGGRAVLGHEAVSEALNRHAVSELVLPYPSDLVTADELLVKALYSSADLEFIEGEAAERLQEEGGVGAFLYYTA